MLVENKIMANALRKIGEIAVPPDAKLRDWKDAFRAHCGWSAPTCWPDETVMSDKYMLRLTGLIIRNSPPPSFLTHNMVSLSLR